VIDEVDTCFLGLEKPKKLIVEGSPQILLRASCVDLSDLNYPDLYCMTDEAFIYFMPSFARLSLLVDDFKSYLPAEDSCFDQAMIFGCKSAFPMMSAEQQVACKCLIGLLLEKSRSPSSFDPSLESWRDLQAEQLWNIIEG
jgi:hypothetical protein